MSRAPLVAVELAGAGEHPAAWRVHPSQPGALLDGTAQVSAARAADTAGIDFATITGTLEAPADAPAQVSTQLDALGLAARIAPATTGLGLVPTVTTTHTEPFHVQASFATLDWVSEGRAGWLVDVSATREAAVAIGRRGVTPAGALWDEALDVVEASRKLWDSWEDDAMIRDVATGRFVDRAKLHHVDHVGPTFSVKGPSIVPRPPQGHPVVVVRVDDGASLAAAAHADVVLLPLHRGDDVAERVSQVRRAVASIGRDPQAVRVLVSASVLVGRDGDHLRGRVLGLVALSGASLTIDLVGTADVVVRELLGWLESGADGVHLRPAVLGVDLPLLLDYVVPLVRGPRPEVRTEPAWAGHTQAVTPARPGTLRDRLGLARPANQYATTAS